MRPAYPLHYVVDFQFLTLSTALGRFFFFSLASLFSLHLRWPSASRFLPLCQFWLPWQPFGAKRGVTRVASPGEGRRFLQRYRKRGIISTSLVFLLEFFFSFPLFFYSFASQRKVSIFDLLGRYGAALFVSVFFICNRGIDRKREEKGIGWLICFSFISLCVCVCAFDAHMLECRSSAEPAGPDGARRRHARRPDAARIFSSKLKSNDPLPTHYLSLCCGLKFMYTFQDIVKFPFGEDRVVCFSYFLSFLIKCCLVVENFNRK